ncbi:MULTISPECIES: HlyD family efflux transporter periplasmic adaptor subunit [Burkholderia]|uniref:HlyD family efflux transporter periplasmic adaptor subunit n=2 Tax=Burkholderia humptydooensis TaxID=430531 RepID=A0A7U4PAI7_9BURK|nr:MULTISPECIES: HlyD family efflux transporter periplasmic adaptor subunit [Burkholderia]AJY38735.1 hlyD secretion family protein [Burkholderia sp. 2002721687]ALX45986.1 secretion protein HlyD [Burkholderia humptydooensis]EIP86986.1 Secretion protein, HlyD family [Burkholderia humptydooensis MSMB43]KVN16790.1 secretion protein HlyD [Burkholderia sp. MSMB1552]KWZ51192.1 secretion protein HlyD [Burkholderia sp. MSMB1588]
MKRFRPRLRPFARALPIGAASAASAACVMLGACSHRDETAWQGYVEGEFVYLASSQSGKLTRLDVARGQHVDANAVVFTLESVDEANALRQAQQQLAAASAQFADLRTGKRAPEVGVTSAQLAQAVATARKAELQSARDEAQYRAGGIPKGQLDDSRAAADAARAQVRELTDAVEVARLPGRPQQLLAQAAFVEAAQAAVAQAQWKLDQTRVAAPAGGRVYDTLYRVGEWVQAGSPVVQMLPPQNVKVRFFVPQAVVGSLAPGRALTIRCDGCASDVAARITYVSSSAEYTPPVIYSNESRSKLVFMVEARPSVDDAQRLHPGQPVSVTLR